MKYPFKEVRNMKITASTDVGRVRKENQDSYYISEANQYSIIADGMGGHNGGEVASQMTISLMRAYIEKQKPKNQQQVIKMLKNGIEEVNQIIFGMARESEQLKGMGTTLIVCYMIGQSAVIVHVGDSRLYHISGQTIEQVTKDHSIVEQLVDQGSITREQAKTHPQKNMITRAIGTDWAVEADAFIINLLKDDKIVLCTDGLTNMVSEDDIHSLVTTEDPQQLVDLANARGGSDNITVIIMKM